MADNINNPCNCQDDDCGCKKSASEIVYIGPTLPCTGIENCDTIDEAFVKINTLLCSNSFIETLITNIINNETLYNQFITLINNSIECSTIIACQPSTTTTTTTIDTSCIQINIDISSGCQSSGLAVVQFTDCSGVLNTVLVSPGDLPTYCVRQFPPPVVLCGDGGFQIIGPCNTTTTTTTAI